jgi:hypothetical protein
LIYNPLTPALSRKERELVDLIRASLRISLQNHYVVNFNKSPSIPLFQRGKTIPFQFERRIKSFPTLEKGG